MAMLRDRKLRRQEPEGLLEVSKQRLYRSKGVRKPTLPLSLRQ